MDTVGASTFGARFDILGEAGSGGMGKVYEAIDRTTNGRVAIKVLTDSGDRERFAREVEILESLEHEAIVKHVGHGDTAAGQPFLAMQWLAGDGLDKRLAHGALPIAEAVELAARLADALAHAHAAGVIHRDLKPSNVMLVDGAVDRGCLIDFGVAKVATGDLTTTGQMIGTPGYMAPEQVRGERSVDRRVDVFALGCVLYETIAGEAPFAGAEVMETLSRLLLERPRELPGTPARLGYLLDAMLAKDVAYRIADCVAVRDELRAIGAAMRTGDEAALAAHAPGIPIPPTDPDGGRPTFALATHSPATQLERPSAKRRAPRRMVGVWIAITVLAAVGGGAVGAYLVLRSTDDVPPPPVVQKTVDVIKKCDDVDRTGCAALCESGDPGACWLYGHAVVSTDIEVARAAYERSCTLGGVFGCLDAAQILLDGEPEPDQIEKAAKLLDRGCIDGDSHACLVAGKHARSDGRWPDPARAFRVVGNVCDDRIDEEFRGNACATLAEMIAKREGTEALRSQAQKLLAGACKRGVKEACKR